MCGLVGVAGDLSLKDENLMKRLLLFDFLRGADSTGLAAIRNTNAVEIAKLAIDPITFFSYPKFITALHGANSKVFLGHNRAATRGEKNNYNAHPFEYEHVVGAHNGTLDMTSWGRLEEAVGEKFSVDSFALIAAIAKIGVKDAIELCTEGKTGDTGAWSLTWYDSNEGSLNFLRNKHRPMWLAYEKDFKRLFWASEWWMIEAAVRAGGAHELHEEGTEKFKYFPTEENQHLKFDIGLMLTSTKKPKPRAQIVEGREPVVATSVFPTRQTGMGFSLHGSGCGSSGTASSKKKNKTHHGTTIQHGGNLERTVHWLGNTHSPLAGYFDEERFKQMAKYGCTWCSRDVMFGEPGVTIFERDDMVLCPKCSGHDEIDDDTENRIYATPENFRAIAQ